MTVDLIFFPLDTIKTRLQARRVAPIATAEGIHKSQLLGARAFYRGLFSAMLGAFPSAATFWTVYQAATDRLKGSLPQNSEFLVATGASTAAEVAVCAVRTPFEVVKQQMQAGLHTSTKEALASILRIEGPRGLYSGAAATITRDIPFDIIQFGLYETLKARLAKHRQRELVLWENSLLGSICAAIAAGVTTPLDVIKTRLMTQTGRPANERYAGWMDAMRRIPAEEGAAVLFSGVRPRVMWISFGGAIFIGSFEELKRRLGAVRSQKAAQVE